MELKRVFEYIFTIGEELIHKKDLPEITLAKMRLASHPAASPQTLMKLSRHDWASIVARVAENPNTEQEALSRLACHAHPDVRIALTENPNTPSSTLAILADDKNADVRYSLAANHNVPDSVLQQLCADENPYVAQRARKTKDRLKKGQTGSASWLPPLRDEQQHSG